MAFVAPAGVVLGRFLGVGTIFEVALVEVDGTSCVCKRLTPRMRTEPRAHAAMEREVGFLERVQHPAVPRLLGRGDDAHGPYVLQTKAPGQSIASLAERGPLPADMLLSVATAAFAALAEIHARPDELALGDLSPEDLFVGKKRGAVCFVDFGQASWRGRAGAPDERGTLPFVPPEVARGEARWTQRSDVYALAALMLFAATGSDFCTSTGAARLAEIGERGIDPAVANVLPEVLRTVLAFDASARPRTAALVHAALRR